MVVLIFFPQLLLFCCVVYIKMRLHLEVRGVDAADGSIDRSGGNFFFLYNNKTINFGYCICIGI